MCWGFRGTWDPEEVSGKWASPWERAEGCGAKGCFENGRWPWVWWQREGSHGDTTLNIWEQWGVVRKLVTLKEEERAGTCEPHRRRGGTCPAVTRGVSSSQLQVGVSARFLSWLSWSLWRGKAKFWEGNGLKCCSSSGEGLDQREQAWWVVWKVPGLPHPASLLESVFAVTPPRAQLFDHRPGENKPRPSSKPEFPQTWDSGTPKDGVLQAFVKSD